MNAVPSKITLFNPNDLANGFSFTAAVHFQPNNKGTQRKTTINSVAFF